MKQNAFNNIPKGFLNKWQEIADLIASIMNVPAALIMKTEKEFMEVFIAGKTQDNPYHAGDKEQWHGLYCETVIKTQKTLRIPNALKDKKWDKNPDIKLGMIAYLGFPLNLPDKQPFGTLCVLDNKERQFTAEDEKLLLQFKKVIELDMALIASLELPENNSDLDVVQDLIDSNEEYQAINEEYQTTNEELKQSYDELFHAKQIAEESEEKYRRIAENVTDVVWITDLKMNPTYISPSVERVLGIKPEEYLKLPVTKTYPPASLEKLQKRLTEEFAKEQDPTSDKDRVFQLEVERYYADGTIGWDAISATFLRDEQMNPIAIQGVSRDITERKNIENELKEKSSFLSTIMETSPVGIVTVNKTGNITYANNRAEQILGLVKEEITSSTYDAPLWNHTELDGSPLPDEKQPFNIVKRTLDTVLNIQHGITWPDGTVVILSINATPIKDNNGKFNGMIASIEDISELRQAEIAIQKEKAWSEKIVNHAPNIIVGMGKKSTIKIFNHYAERLTGYKADEVIGEEWINTFIPEELKETVYQVWDDIVSKKMIEHYFENEIITKTGKKRQIEWCNTILTENGEFRMVLSIGTDITERKQSELALKESEERFKALHNASFGGIAIHDKGMILECNQGLSEMTGYSIDELIGMDGLLLIAPESRDMVMKNILSGYEKPYEAFGLKKNNEIYAMRLEARNIPYKGKNVRTVEFRDITERKKGEMLLKEKNEAYESINEELKQTNNELITAKEKAEESDRLKSAFLANMSHEIRTPMNGILGFANFLKKPNLTGEQQQKYVSVIEDSGARMLNIINDIIDISKIEAGLMKLNIGESNINEQTEYIYTFFKPEVKAKGMKLSLSNALPKEASVIYTDREKVYAILTNLVKNAIKYSNEGTIDIGYKMVESQNIDYLQFYVKDTGIGIPKERQKIIFERFMQAEIEDKMARQGAGLGLSISKAYVKMLGGEIWVESKEGSGATFYFTLPYKTNRKENDYQNGASFKADNSRKLKLAGLKILIAEDDEVSQFMLDEEFSTIGKEILTATTGIEAVEACRDNADIDLVLMDIRMPQMDGYEATRQIRQFNKDVVIIAQTAYGLTGDREKALEAGCSDYIAKPIDINELYALIEKHTSSR